MTTSSSKSKELFTWYSLEVSGDKIGFRYLSNKYVGIFIADEIGQNLGVFLTNAWRTLRLPYKMTEKVLTGQILFLKFSPHF